MNLRISERGWARASAYFKGVGRRARNLVPLRDNARERWREAEARQFASNGWSPRTPQTLLRYTWPITGTTGSRVASAASRGTGHFTGDLAYGLTHPNQPGIKDTVIFSNGELITDFGVTPNGPLSHGNYFQDGAGAQDRRELFVWDQPAQDALAGDAQDHLEGVLR